MARITIRKGKPEDSAYFSQLMLFSAPEFFPYIFGSNVRDIVRNLFKEKRNWFSFENSYFVKVDGDIAGMALVFGSRLKKEEEPRTIGLLAKYMEGSSFMEPPDPRTKEYTAQIGKRDYYISNIGIFPKFRCMGCGTKLLERVEKEAKKIGSERMVLDVEVDNERAIKLYERLGYHIEKRSPVLETNIKNFEFFMMTKKIEKDDLVIARKVTQY
jgi:ribosomal protein S18 acetylase RimI-like enzyme